jgi:tRNA threonylcarbamoyladenosine biosynthesis protein TsaB
MKILALETSTLTGSVALLEMPEGASDTERKIVGEITLSVSVQHSERLLPMVDQLLSQCGCALSEIDLFAVSVGPGSFTGLRIGIAAAQGFALSTGKPLVGVSTLKALAMNGFGFDGVVLPLLNAFRGEVYAGLYVWGGKDVVLFGEEGVIAPRVLREEMEKVEKDLSFLVLGNGVGIAWEEIASLGPERLIAAPFPLHMPRASHVGFLAFEEFSKSPNLEKAVVPNYLRFPG